MLFIERKNVNNLKKTGLFGRLTSLTGKTSGVSQYDKWYETDRQMLVRVGSKFAVIFFIITLFDPLSDLFLGICYAGFEMFQLFMEVIENVLEATLENTLNTGKHQSEIIIANSGFLIALYGLYRLYFALPELSTRCKNHLQEIWLSYVTRESSCWQAQPFDRKLKLVSAYTFGIACILFGLTL